MQYSWWIFVAAARGDSARGNSVGHRQLGVVSYECPKPSCEANSHSAIVSSFNWNCD